MKGPPSTLLAAFCLVVIPPHAAFALITGGKGNEPVPDPGWPEGAAIVFNTKCRVACWEGPPLGGGQSFAECRGTSDEFNAVLVQFAEIKSTPKRLVIHDGIGQSFWLNMNDEPDKRDAAAIEWRFMVWQPKQWQKQKELPPGLRSSEVEAAGEPVTQIDFFTGGRIRWEEVKVPVGIEVDDQRLEAHGYSADSGTVLEGTLTDTETGAPVTGAVRLDAVSTAKTGGYGYTEFLTVRTDPSGRWVARNVPAQWFRLLASADGYAPRVLGYAREGGRPQWRGFDGRLAREAKLTGRVIDADGAPLADVAVRLSDVATGGGQMTYKLPDDFRVQTGPDGRFTFNHLPTGTARVRASKEGLIQIGLGPTVDLPGEIEVTLSRAAAVRVVVDFSQTMRPAQFLVEMAPEEGEMVGRWSGSGQIDAAASLTFRNVPPGRYVIYGRPNPGRKQEETARQTLDLIPGETTEVVLIAK